MTERALDAIRSLRLRRDEVLAELPAEKSGARWCLRHSKIADEAVRAAYEEVVLGFQDQPSVSVVATGGYGRSEIAPHSDLDVVIIPVDEAHPQLDPFVRSLYRGLLDAGGVLGLEVGYAYRLPSDAPALDGKSRTSMLDARLICGSEEGLERFRREFDATFPIGDFLIDKLRERALQHAVWNDTPLVAEPNLKEGSGGLRSSHAARWILAAIDEREARACEGEYDRILHARNLLQWVSGKKSDHLTRPRQAEIADALGVELNPWLSELLASGEELHREFQMAKAKVRSSTYLVSAAVRALRGKAEVQPGSSIGEAAMGLALATELGLEVGRGAPPEGSFADGAYALHALSFGEPTVRSLDESGLLEQMLPELAACRTLVPEDATHRYTVFEHSLRAIRALDAMESRPHLGDLMRGIASKGPLVLALLLHDVGKAKPSRPHEEVGAEIAEAVCGRWGLSGGTTLLVTWLVREHLTLAKFLRMRDIHDPRTARELADRVQTQERLDHLTLLTVADISAVGDETWTAAQAELLRELWARTVDALESRHAPPPDVRSHRQRLKRELRESKVEEADLQAFLDSLPVQYLIATPPTDVPVHMAWARLAREGEPQVDVRHRPAVGRSELSLCSLDSHGLLSRVLAVLYAWDVSVHSIRASTTTIEPHVALDTFEVSFGGQCLPAATERHVMQDLEAMLRGLTCADDVMRKQGKDPDRRQEHFTYSFVEGNPGILEIAAPRGRGMAYRMSRWIAERGWNITAARIGQWAGRASAAFYLCGAEGEAIDRAEVQTALDSKV